MKPVTKSRSLTMYMTSCESAYVSQSHTLSHTEIFFIPTFALQHSRMLHLEEL